MAIIDDAGQGIVIFRQIVEDPDLSAVRTLRRGLESADITALPVETREAFSFFVSETVTNLIEHTRIPPSQIVLELVTTAGAWVCRILDNGPTFEGFDAQLAMSYEKWNSNKGFQESGIGLALISRMLPDNWYETSAERVDVCNAFSVRYPARRSIINRPRILLVDDDELTRSFLRIVLQDEYQISSYPGATLALEKFHESPVDLVISDINMPEMDGLSFRQALVDRGDDLIPFVFLTSDTDDDVSRQADELAIDDYILKPIDPPRLKSTVRRLLNRRNSILEKVMAQLSRELTETLTSDLPEHIGAIQCAVARRVPSAGGGDLVIPIGEDGIFIADVMGHGLGAKMVAHAVSAYARSQILQMGSEWTPGSLMSGISDAICADDSLDAVIVTAALVRISPDGNLKISSAGHPMPIRLGLTGFGYVEVGGPLLGLTQNQTYGETEFTLVPGMALVLMTDGLFEIDPSAAAQNAAEQRICAAGFSALEQSMNAGEIADQILGEYDDITGGEPNDDTTVVVLKH